MSCELFVAYSVHKGKHSPMAIALDFDTCVIRLEEMLAQGAKCAAGTLINIYEYKRMGALNVKKFPDYVVNPKFIHMLERSKHAEARKECLPLFLVHKETDADHFIVGAHSTRKAAAAQARKAGAQVSEITEISVAHFRESKLFQ